MHLYFFRQWEIFNSEGAKWGAVIIGLLIIYGVVFSIAYLVLFLTGSRLVEEGRRLAPIAVFSFFITLLIIMNAIIRVEEKKDDDIKSNISKEGAAAFAVNTFRKKTKTLEIQQPGLV